MTSVGTAHVRALHEFLLSNLSAETRAVLLTELRRDGYRGPDDLCLLEHCVRMEDPVGFLASEFTARDLSRAVERVLGSVPAGRSNDRQLATILLEAFGFPAQPRPRGLKTVIDEVERLRAECGTATVVNLRGIVAAAAIKIEAIVETLLRFVCHAVFAQAPEARFRDRGLLPPGRDLGKSTLGTLLDLLGHLSKDIEAETARVSVLARDLEVRRLAPDGTSGIARFRNQFAHCGKIDDDTPIAEARRTAAEFFTEALALLTYLKNPESRVFPHIIRIERITIDRWGRCVVDAEGDEGVPEHIFTDRALVPGELYFMHPFSNPLRVDPILIPAGVSARALE